MKTIVGAIILAIVFFVASAVAFAEARLARQVSDAHQRLALLRYDANDGIDEAAGLLAHVQLPGLTPTEDVARHRTTVMYWRKGYDQLAPITAANGPNIPADTQIRLIAANSAFRESHPEEGERKVAIDRLNAIMQNYADILRADANNVDAAYNYEFVVRMRDKLAKATGARKNDFKTEPDLPSPDLPIGPTVHGRPGGPPPDVMLGSFNTISPMRYDEREDQQEMPGKGGKKQRKG